MPPCFTCRRKLGLWAELESYHNPRSPRIFVSCGQTYVKLESFRKFHHVWVPWIYRLKLSTLIKFLLNKVDGEILYFRGGQKKKKGQSNVILRNSNLFMPRDGIPSASYSQKHIFSGPWKSNPIMVDFRRPRQTIIQGEREREKKRNSQFLALFTLVSSHITFYKNESPSAIFDVSRPRDRMMNSSPSRRINFPENVLLGGGVIYRFIFHRARSRWPIWIIYWAGNLGLESPGHASKFSPTRFFFFFFFIFRSYLVGTCQNREIKISSHHRVIKRWIRLQVDFEGESYPGCSPSRAT